MRGSVHVTGTHDRHDWDQFTALRACLGPVNAYETTAPDEEMPRLTRGRTHYHGSLTLYRSRCTDRPETSVCPVSSVAGDEPLRRTAATLTAVLRASAEDVAHRADLPQIAGRPPAVARPSACCASSPTAPRATRRTPSATPPSRAPPCLHGRPPWPPGGPSPAGSSTALTPVLLLMVADVDGWLVRQIRVMEWKAPYFREQAEELRTGPEASAPRSCRYRPSSDPTAAGQSRAPESKEW
ncbi:hypothetical protein [Streptomyces siamensis]|uniref:Uncharacterized protein n=1 Tax=Streptomyces siamensis TaxID=1274986 RepID=A0ABP9J978_9ACTN